MTERIEKDGELVAVIIRRGEEEDAGYHAAVPDEYSLQMGTNIMPSGRVAKAHVHIPFDGPVKVDRYEAFHVDKGRIKLTLYTKEGVEVCDTELAEGDTVLLIGGHRVEALEDSRIILFKQGPYPGREKDKRFFEE